MAEPKSIQHHFNINTKFQGLYIKKLFRRYNSNRILYQVSLPPMGKASQSQRPFCSSPSARRLDYEPQPWNCPEVLKVLTTVPWYFGTNIQKLSGINIQVSQILNLMIPRTLDVLRWQYIYAQCLKFKGRAIRTFNSTATATDMILQSEITWFFYENFTFPEI